MENIFLFYWKETLSYFNEKKTCLLVYYSYMSLNFTTKIYLSFWLKNCICIDWKFLLPYFPQNSFLVLSKQKFFQFYWQNIFFISFNEKSISIILSENFYWLYWQKIPFHLNEGKSLSSLLLEIHFILLTEKILSC